MESRLVSSRKSFSPHFAEKYKLILSPFAFMSNYLTKFKIAIKIAKMNITRIRDKKIIIDNFEHFVHDKK